MPIAADAPGGRAACAESPFASRRRGKATALRGAAARAGGASPRLQRGGGFGEAGSKRNVVAVLDSDATCGDEGWL